MCCFNPNSTSTGRFFLGQLQAVTNIDNTHSEAKPVGRHCVVG